MTNRGSRTYYDDIVATFVACPRCSLFLAGCRIVVGQENLQAAVENSAEGYLTLAWNATMRELTLKAYGRRVDIDAYYYEGCCPECYRLFAFYTEQTQAEPTEMEPTGAPACHFRLELRPRTPR